MSQRPRQVIWITTDHMRYDGIGANGNPAMHTPNLDALAAGGVSFDRCYANNPVCMPSRCSFMTGCYPAQTGVMDNGQELPPDFRPTVAHAFAAGGYRTVQIGKLHFQNHEDCDLDPRARHAYGFDVLQLAEEPGCYEDAYRTWLRGEHPELVETFTIARPMTPERHRDHTHHRVLDAPWEASFSGWIATQACRYLGAWGPRRDPQFLHLGFYAPHPPLNPTRDMFAPYDGVPLPPPARAEHDWNDGHLMSDALFESYRRHFYAMITGVDLAIGKLTAYLKEQGTLDDTLLVFGSDHGDLCGDHGRFGKNTTYYEGIMRLPLILHWPKGLGTTPRRVDGLIEMVDVLLTLLELADLPVPTAMQGRSYARELRERTPIAGRDDVYAVHLPGQLMLRTRTHKYLRYPEGDGCREVLYDLANDPDEFRNVVDAPENRELLHQLRDRALTRSLHATQSLSPHRLRF